jgi:hypothetical protein
VSHVQERLYRQSIFFETMSKRRKGFPSETRVKRGIRKVMATSCSKRNLVAKICAHAEAASGSKSAA